MSAVRVVIGTAIAAALGVAAGGGVLVVGGMRSGMFGGGEPRPHREAGALVGTRAGPAESAPTAATTVAADPATTPPAPSASAFVPTVAAPVPRFLLGLNEAVSIPGKVIAQGRFGPGWIEKHLEQDAASAVAVGARVVRSHTGAFPRNSWFDQKSKPDAVTHADAWVRTVQKAGLTPIMMVSPWPGNRTANSTERYVPEDMASYTAYVRATVERYDGDGIDDMPGLTAPITYWEVDNEPDLKYTMPPRDSTRPVKPGTFCSPKEAATVLVATSKAIKAAYPGALVLNGGIYRPAADQGRDYLRALWAEPGVPEAVDIVSLHSYASDEQGALAGRALSNARAIVGARPIFLTETSVPSEGDKPFISPEWQARMVAAFVARAASGGVQALLWHTLADPPASARHDGGFSKHSLFRQLGEDGALEEKPAAAVYRNLSARIAEDDILGATEAGEGAVRARSGAILLFSGTRTAAKGGIDLRNGQQIPAGGSAEAPAWLWP